MHRTNMEHTVQILRACGTPHRNYGLMRRVGMNYLETKRLLDYLLHREFLACEDGFYMVTPYGLDFLEGLELLLEMWLRSFPEKHVIIRASLRSHDEIGRPLVPSMLFRGAPSV